MSSQTTSEQTPLLDLHALIAHPEPETLVSAALWTRWVSLLDPTTLAASTRSLASSAGLGLPEREWNTLAQDIVGFPFADQLPEVRRTLVLLVSSLVTAPYLVRPILPSEQLELLLQSRDPAEHVSDELWRSWANALRSSKADHQYLGEIADGLGLPWPASRSAERLGDYLSLSPRDISELPGIGKKKLRTVVSGVAYAVHKLSLVSLVSASSKQQRTTQRQTAADESDLPAHSVADAVSLLLSRLSPRQRKVLSLRYGLGGAPVSKLREIGESLSLSRERVRQIESRALGKLRMGASEVSECLYTEADALWEQFADGDDVVQVENSETILLSRLAPEFRLAFRICDLSANHFLDTIASRVDRGWYRASIDGFLLERVIFQLDHDTDQPFPMSAKLAAEKLDAHQRVVRIAATLSARVQLYKGYLWRGPLGRRGRRTVWLHRILATFADKTSVSVEELVSLHNRARPQASCTVRDAEIVMVRHPHMFVQMGKGMWTGAGGLPLLSLSAVDEDEFEADTLAEDDEAVSASTAVGALTEILREKGPLRMQEIADLFEARTGYRRTTVGPLLITHGEFVRLAPGVYGLPNHLQDEHAQARARKLVLTNEACAEYTRARYSGESFDTFPLWKPRLEREWCEWAQVHAEPGVFASLLSVARPSDWPSDDGLDIADWLARKGSTGSYRLDEELRLLLPEQAVALRDLLPPVIYAAREGALGWVTINRLRGSRHNDGTGVAYLGLLAAGNIVVAPDDWRVAHQASDAAQELSAELLRELELSGQLRWNTDLGQHLLERIHQGLSAPSGWMNRSLADLLQDALPTLEREKPERGRILSWAIVQLGMAIANVDGELHLRERERVRALAAEELQLSGWVVPSIKEQVENLIAEPSVEPIAAAKRLAQTLSSTSRNRLIEHLFHIAAADGVFRQSESELLMRLREALEVDAEYFESLYRAHAKDPRTGAGLLAERLRRPSDPKELADLVSLLTLS